MSIDKMTEGNCLSFRLLQAARELKKAEYIREFRQNYEKELNSPSEQTIQTNKEASADHDKSPESATECLRMAVFEDKEYDIEEVKFWNFISKNKGLKPSIIRTVVYKYPETSYVINKVPVYFSKPEVHMEKNNDVCANNNQIKESEVCKTLKIDTVETGELKQSEQHVVEKVPYSQAFSKTSPKLSHFDSKNYKMEDMILIDEDDDIIGYNELSDEEINLAESNQIADHEDAVEVMRETTDIDELVTQTTDTDENYNLDSDTDNDQNNQKTLDTDKDVEPRKYKQRGRKSNASKRIILLSGVDIKSSDEPEVKRIRHQLRLQSESKEVKNLPSDMPASSRQIARVTRSRSKLSGSNPGMNSPASSTSSRY